MSDVVSLSLGLEPGKEGLGVSLVPEHDRQEFRAAVHDPQNRLRELINVYMCIDGRNEFGLFCQIAGALAVAELANDLMSEELDATDPQNRVAETLARETSSAIADGFEVTVHGDEHKGEAGCAANNLIEDILRNSLENIDVIAPVAWTIAEHLGLNRWISETEAINQIGYGNTNANNAELWNADVKERDKIIVAHGGKYMVLPGSHHEGGVAITLDENETVDRQAISEQHKATDGEPLQLFVATLGAYAKDTFDRAQKHGRTPRQAALRVMSAISFNVSALSMLCDDETVLDLLGKAYQPADWVA